MLSQYRKDRARKVPLTLLCKRFATAVVQRTRQSKFDIWRCENPTTFFHAVRGMQRPAWLIAVDTLMAGRICHVSLLHLVKKERPLESAVPSRRREDTEVTEIAKTERNSPKRKGFVSARGRKDTEWVGDTSPPG